MIHFTDIRNASLDTLTDELAAAGWDSTQTDICAAREAVVRLLCESMTTDQLMTALDNAGFKSNQDWDVGTTTWTIFDDLRVQVEGNDVEVQA